LSDRYTAITTERYYTATHYRILDEMENRQRLQVKTVGVIGAGVSGVASAIHLRKAGLEVTVFERNSHVGGVWWVPRFPVSITFLNGTDFRSGSSTSAHPETLRIPLRNLRSETHPSMKD
jgi:monoamine oxidase